MVNFEKFMLCQEVTDPCNEIPTVPPPPEPDGEDDNTGGSNTGNTPPLTPPDPNWGLGGFSIDNPEDEEKE